MKLTDVDAHSVRHIVENMRAHDRAEIFATRFDDDEKSLIREVVEHWGPFRAVAWNDNPIAVFGATQLHPGVWRAFMFATDDWPLVSFRVTRFIKRRLIPAVQDTGAHRCEALTLAEHFEAHRWLHVLGAQHEGSLLRFGRAAEDFHVYRWDNVHRQ